MLPKNMPLWLKIAMYTITIGVLIYAVFIVNSVPKDSWTATPTFTFTPKEIASTAFILATFFFLLYAMLKPRK